MSRQQGGTTSEPTEPLSPGKKLTARTRPAMRLDAYEREIFRELCKTVDPRIVGHRDNNLVCVAAKMRAAIERANPADSSSMALQRYAGVLGKLGLSPDGRSARMATAAPEIDDPRDSHPILPNPFMNQG